MPLVSIAWNRTPRQLRQFACAAAVVLPLICWSVTGGRAGLTIAAALAGAALAVAGWLRPSLVRPVFLAISLATWPIGRVMSELVLLAVYYGVIAPMGLAMRLVGRDPLERRFDRRAASYWHERQDSADVERNFRQY